MSFALRSNVSLLRESWPSARDVFGSEKKLGFACHTHKPESHVIASCALMLTTRTPIAGNIDDGNMVQMKT